MNSPLAAFRRSAAALELAEVLLEALQILQDARQTEAAPVETTTPERVYVPHMERWGTVQQIYNELLIGVMLDDGIFMQTSRAFVSSEKDDIYNEESIRIPSEPASKIDSSEGEKIKQLSMF